MLKNKNRDIPPKGPDGKVFKPQSRPGGMHNPDEREK
jgi:hypothetical protein